MLDFIFFSQIEAIKGCTVDKSKLGNAEQFYAELIGLPGILSELSFNVLGGFEMSLESQNRLSSNVTYVISYKSIHSYIPG